MRGRRCAGICAAGAFALLIGAVFAPAAYASYGNDGGLTVMPTQVAPGDSISVTSTGWKSKSSVTITLHSTPVVLGTATSDASGNVNKTVTIPAGTATGSHSVVLDGSSTAGVPLEVSTPLTVISGGGGGGALPRTGAAIAALLIVGLLLFAGGSALSTARKRAVR